MRLKYGLIGFPVMHSLSPQMQEAGFAACGIDASYECLETPPDKLSERFQWLVDNGFSGWNVTVPHKEHVLTLLNKIDAEAELAGSVNTVLNNNGLLTGFSTDGYGLETAAMEAFNIPFKNSALLFLGTGGAARATAVHAAIHGANPIFLVNRTPEKAQRIADTIAKLPNPPHLQVIPLADTDRVAQAAALSRILFQCTSLGLKPDDPPPFPANRLPKSLSIMDMVYGPTRFKADAVANGCNVADGTGMLLHQGCRSFTIWTGLAAPVEPMRHALQQALRQRACQQR